MPETRQQKEGSQLGSSHQQGASPAQKSSGQYASGNKGQLDSTQIAAAMQNMQKEFQRQMHVLHQSIATNQANHDRAMAEMRQEIRLTAQSTRAAATSLQNNRSTGNNADEASNVPGCSQQPRGALTENVSSPNGNEAERQAQASGESLTTTSFHSHPLNPTKKIYPLPKFGGEPEAWPPFIEDFRRSTEEFGYSDLHNIMRMREALHDRARDSVESLLSSSLNVKAILELLEETYGRPELLIKSQIENVRRLQIIKEGNLDQLVEFAMKVNNMATFLKMCKGEHHLTNPILLSEIVAKLPVARQMQWAEKCVMMERVPNVYDFSVWLSSIRKLANFVSDILPTTTNVNNTSRKVRNSDAQMLRDGKSKRYAFVSVTIDKCSICQKECDEVVSCGKFLSMAIDDRWQKAREAKLCFLCLKTGHRTDKCSRKTYCGVNNCNRKHHGLLHKPVITTGVPAVVENVSTSRTNLHVATENENILFQVVPVNLYGPKGVATIYAFVDDGADVTMLDWSVARQIGLQGEDTPLQLQWLNGSCATGPSKIVECDISGIEAGVKKYKLKCVYLSKDLDLPTQSLSMKNMGKFPHINGLQITEYKNAKPKMVLSLSHAFLTVPVDTPVTPPFCGPIAIKTRIGWILYGPTGEGEKMGKRACYVRALETKSLEVSMDQMMRQFFDTEVCGVKLDAAPVMSADTKTAYEILKSTLRFVDVRYECGLLWKRDFVEFPSSYKMALNRFYKLEKRMIRKKEYRAQYCGVVHEFLKKGYARRLSPTEAGEISPKTFFLPHFGVVNPNKQNLRLVFDAAAKCDGFSLNDALLPGPDLNQPLLAVLMKFRMEKIAVCGDLKEMFLQVAVKRDDQDALRFLWRSNPEEDIGQYCMTRMIFGSTCSPTIAQYVKNTHAEKFVDTYNRAVNAIVEHHYVDDYVDCFRFEEDAIKVIKQVKDIHKKAGFELCKIVSNSAIINGEFGEKGAQKVDVSANRVERVLGLFWLSSSDEFIFDLNFQRIPKDILTKRRIPTKREVLSVTMSIFDPFGFLGNFVITAKIIMQLLWKCGSEWDEVIPDGLFGRWVVWLGELEKVRDYKIPRCYYFNSYCAKKHLHIFSDASEQAMATVAYWRIEDQDGVRLAFVMGKTNCAPTRAISIPRLELQAAVYAVRLKNCIERFHGFNVDSVQYWSDSHTVIRWIENESRLYKQFVANRIAEILEGSDESQWRWVPGDLNPADDGTRAAAKLNIHSRWINGPQFLLLTTEKWPSFPGEAVIDRCNEELKTKMSFVLATRCEKRLEFDAYNSSNYHRLWRGIAWALRFAFNMLTVLTQKPRRSGMLTTDELDEADVYMWRLVQMQSFKQEYERLVRGEPVSAKSDLKTLNPYVDERGLIRCSGRIDNAPHLRWQTKRPIILPKNHRLTRLLVEWYHRRLQHVNKHTVINEIRLRFWIPSIRVLVNSVFSQCFECKRRGAKPSPPIMGNLPKDRLTSFVRPFSYAGVDYFGPIEVTCRRSREKRWVALFTCMAIRAVHLEVAMDLSSDAFLVCIRNFINRRGVPVQMRSDNGTNFVGLSKELGKEAYFLDHDAITEALSPLGIKWKFNTPANPSEGGVWERLVRSVKRSLSVVMKEQAPRVETLISLLIECENVINSRPLTHLPLTPTEPEPLTPNHFLLGCANSTQTPTPFDKRLCSSRKQWRILQNLKNLFWQRWMQEYLPGLTRRVKWCRPSKPFTIGALVLLCEAELPRPRWRKGKITKLLVGPDGVARSAEVQTATGLLRRPVSKLAPLDVCEKEGEDGVCTASIHGGGDVGDS